MNLYNADCLEIMPTIPDNSIDLTVTSPPYDNLRTYNNSLEWGEHIWKPIIQELYRITKSGGVVVWVVGDATIKGSETGTSFKQALYFKEVGFNLHDTMIYLKSMPPLTHNRYEPNFEYMFIFCKFKINTFNGIVEEKKYLDKRENRNFRRESNGEYDKGFSKKETTKKLKTNVWKIFAGGGANDKYASEHPAVFPEQLANDHIISWSNENDIVFDPFLGSGTTGKMAILNNRNFIGIEKDKTYFEIARKRIDEAIENKKELLFK